MPASHSASRDPARLAHVLEARERALRDRIARARNALEHHSPVADPAGDQADQAFSRDRALIESDLLELSLRELAEIGHARERLAAGTYGQCADCGDEIGAPRLEAQPAARRCARCQTQHEKQFASP